MAMQSGVTEVHDLHVWEVTSGFPALSAHVLVKAEVDCHESRRELAKLLMLPCLRPAVMFTRQTISTPSQAHSTALSMMRRIGSVLPERAVQR